MNSHTVLVCPLLFIALMITASNTNTFGVQPSSSIKATSVSPPKTAPIVKTDQPLPHDTQPDSLCIAGHVVSGGDKSPGGLTDAPRQFAYKVERDNGGTIEVRYTAFPPGPTLRPRPKLDFHQGTIKIGDYLKACGRSHSGKLLQIFRGNHSIQTIPTTRVLVVRHADKADQANPNTNLDPDIGNTGKGVNRAEALTSKAVAAGVKAIYTSEFCRTAQTVQPSARALDLGLKVLSDSFQFSTLTDCNPVITVPVESQTITFDAASELAAVILTNYLEGVVMVAGHSNTVPEIVEALSGESLCPRFFGLTHGECEIPEDRFGDLFVVSIPPAPGRSWVTHDSY